MFLLGCRIDNISMQEALAKMRVFLIDGRQHYIVTPNSEFLVRAQKDEEFREILNNADLAVPDSTGVVWASRFLGEPLKERVSGVDLMENIKQQCVIASEVAPAGERGNPVAKLSNNGDGGIGSGLLRRSSLRDSLLTMTDLRIFLLGGKNGEAKKIAGNWLEVVGYNEEQNNCIGHINECQPNILLVALGAPKQEKWIAQNLKKVPSVKLAIGVGGAFDVLSGKISRAPRFMQKIGLEWLWRLMQEPKRLPRIFNAIVKFPLLVLIKK